MRDSPKNRLINLFWNVVINLVEVFQETWERVANRKSFAGIRTIMKEVNHNLRGPFFRVVLRKDEALADFSKDQLDIGSFLTIIKAGQYRLEKRMVKWGDNNPETFWLVLENTTIGAREAWWSKRADSGEIFLKIDVDL